MFICLIFFKTIIVFRERYVIYSYNIYVYMYTYICMYIYTYIYIYIYINIVKSHRTTLYRPFYDSPNNATLNALDILYHHLSALVNDHGNEVQTKSCNLIFGITSLWPPKVHIYIYIYIYI